MTDLDESVRRNELRVALAAVEERITRACGESGRARDDVTLIAVTKRFPASDVRLLARLGVDDVGENNVQELVAKSEVHAYAGLRLHVVGRLQSNKAAVAASLAELIHSLDRRALIGPLARGAARGQRRLSVLIQVSLDGDPARGGVRKEDVVDLAQATLDSPLRLKGVMAVPPVGAEPVAAFTRLREISKQVRELCPDAEIISAGMSADLEAAVVSGATHLRVGSAILGSRRLLG